MAKKSRKEFQRIFDLEEEDTNAEQRIDFNKLQKRKTIEKAVKELETLDVKKIYFNLIRI
jgi:hypothetical protein